MDVEMESRGIFWTAFTFDADDDDVWDWEDNCPRAANTDQLDTLGNGVGDACRAFQFAEPAPYGADASVKVTKAFGTRLVAAMVNDVGDLVLYDSASFGSNTRLVPMRSESDSA